MAITLVDVPFFAAAAWAGRHGMKTMQERSNPADILPPGFSPAPPAIKRGDRIPDLCPGSDAVTRRRDEMLAATTSPGGPAHRVNLKKAVREIFYEIDQRQQGCWRTIRHQRLRRAGNKAWDDNPIRVRWIDGKDDSGNVMPPGGTYRIRIYAPGTKLGGLGPGWLDFGFYQGEFHDGGLSGMTRKGNPTLLRAAERGARLGGLGFDWGIDNPSDAIGAVDSVCCQFGMDFCCKASDKATPIVTPLPGPMPPYNAPPRPSLSGGIPWTPIILGAGALATVGLVLAVRR